MLVDDRFGLDVLEQAVGSGWWVARPVEESGSCPLRFEGGPAIGTRLRNWPAQHVVKCLVHYHPDDPEQLRAVQDRA
jgi:5-dehydro-2-deoxygluconokinase